MTEARDSTGSCRVLMREHDFTGWSETVQCNGERLHDPSTGRVGRWAGEAVPRRIDRGPRPGPVDHFRT